jgi:coenzyme F420-reducing hydrogenase gamma subunit
MTIRPKAAFFSFTCCEGCQLTILSCEDELPSILEHIEIVNFREAMTERSEDYQVAFIEGSVSRREEIKKVKKIREKAKVVVALGACSAIGGLNCLKNRFSMDYIRKEVYGQDGLKFKAFETIPARPIDSIIPVDYYIHGCPIPKKEFLSVLTSLLMGSVPCIANHPVCVDCKIAGNICVFEKGKTCLGPITRAGCDAVCVTYGCVCWGCRGQVSDPNTPTHKETLLRHGLSADEVPLALSLYGAHQTKTVSKN